MFCETGLLVAKQMNANQKQCTKKSPAQAGLFVLLSVIQRIRPA
jgi:hypothetical protein